MRKLSYADPPHPGFIAVMAVGSRLLRLLREGRGIYLREAPQRLALALAKHVIEERGDAIACVNPALWRIAGIVLGRDNVRTCDDCCSRAEARHLVNLWCGVDCVDKAILVVGTLLRRYKSYGLVKTIAKRIDSNLYLVTILDEDNGVSREYVAVDDAYTLAEARNPCREDEVVNILRSYFAASKVDLRESLELISAELRISKTEARRKIMMAAEKGCIDIDTREKKILLY